MEYVISWLWLAAAAFGGAIFGFYMGCVVVAAGKRTPVPEGRDAEPSFTYADVEALRARGYERVNRPGEWATPENVAAAEEELI